MRKIIFTSWILILTNAAFGQITKPDSSKKEFKNIIELNANGIIHQILNLSPGAYFPTPYILSYKRVFKSNAIRFGLGGTFSSNNSTMNDTVKNNTKRNSFNVGIGIEHYCYISKRWSFFFGIDAIANYTEDGYFQNSSATVSDSERKVAYGYGVSPLLGIQFKISSRMSVTTETSYDVTYVLGRDTRVETPLPIYNTDTKSHGFQSNINPPISINFRVHF